MVNNSSGENRDQRCRCQTIVQQLTRFCRQNKGLTLIELLAGLIIAAIISTVVIYLISFEFRSWQRIVPNSDVRSNVTFTSNALQQVLQDVSFLTPDANYPTGTALTGQDANGNTVEIRLQQPGTDQVVMVGSNPIEGIVVTDKLGSGSQGPVVLPDTTYFFNDTSFAGTTFQIDGSLVSIHLDATFYGGQSPINYQLTEKYALGGGD